MSMKESKSEKCILLLNNTEWVYVAQYGTFKKKKRKLFSKHNRLPKDPTLGNLRSPFCSVTEHFSLQELRAPSLTRIIYLQDELAESVNEMSANPSVFKFGYSGVWVVWTVLPV